MEPTPSSKDLVQDMSENKNMFVNKNDKQKYNINENAQVYIQPQRYDIHQQSANAQKSLNVNEIALKQNIYMPPNNMVPPPPAMIYPIIALPQKQLQITAGGRSILLPAFCPFCKSGNQFYPQKKAGIAFVSWTITLCCLCWICAFIPMTMDECYDYQIICVNCHSVVMTDKSDYCCCD